MPRITVQEDELKYVQPANDILWMNKGIMEYWEDLTSRNGGQLENLRRAHHELQELLARAVKTSQELSVDLDDIEVICPQLLDQSAWKDYSGAWDRQHCCTSLQKWFDEQFGNTHKFYVDAHPKLGERHIYTRVKIDFSKRDVEKYSFTFRA